MENEILVIGGNGKTGKRVADRLTQLNLKFRIASRSSSPVFDWTEPATWSSALKGISKVYITFQPDLAVPGSVDAISKFVETAKLAGVKHLVLLSGRGEKEAKASEDIVINSGLDWTIVRASWFMQNFSESFLLDSVLAGEVVLPQVKAAEPFIDTDDIADVVVAALTNPAHRNKLYEVTGPELLTFKQATTIIANTLKRPISYQEIPMEDYVAMLKSYEVPDDYIWLISYLFTEVLDGRNESITNDVEKVLGRKAGTFKEYALKVRVAGNWAV